MTVWVLTDERSVVAVLESEEAAEMLMQHMEFAATLLDQDEPELHMAAYEVQTLRDVQGAGE